MKQPNEELLKQFEKDIELLDYDYIKSLNSELIDFSKLTETWLPEINENTKKLIREKLKPIATFEKITDKLEFVNINKPEAEKEIIRIPSISYKSGGPYILVENSKGREEIITIHRSLKKTISKISRKKNV